MSTIHKNLTGADLHEPKGADTALVGQVYVSNGSGGGVWTAASSIITNTAFTTGDLKITHKSTADTSWILWQEGTIGDASSGATLRANADTAALFTLYWNISSLTLQNSSGANISRGASAVADYATHCRINVPVGPGRALTVAGTGTNLTTRTLGTGLGAETVTLLTVNLPAYTPTGTVSVSVTSSNSVTKDGFIDTINSGATGTPVLFSRATGATQGALTSNGTGTFTGAAQGGTSTPVSIIPPETYVNVMIKL